MSSNPWRVTASFQTVSSTREEYIATIETLKKNQPPPPSKPNAKPTKQAQAHMALIAALESRIPAIDNELAVRINSRSRLIRRVLTRHSSGSQEYGANSSSDKPCTLRLSCGRRARGVRSSKGIRTLRRIVMCVTVMPLFVLEHCHSL